VAEQHTTGVLDFESLRHAIEQSDAESLTGFYTEDDEMLTISATLLRVLPEYCAARSRSPST
jgi:hypothetical protein